MSPPAAPDQLTAPAADAATHMPDLVAQFREVLLARRRFILLVTLAALVLAILHLRTADYVHEAQLRVAAAPGSASRTPRLGSLSGLAALAGVGMATEASPFRLYLEDLTSPPTATELARDKTIMQGVFADEWTGSGWVPKASLLDRSQAFLLALAGKPVAATSEPDANRLAAWLARNIDISEDERSSVVTLHVRHRDPAFASLLLERLHAVADARARARATARAQANIAHLDQRLAKATPLDLRQALYATRAVEEQRLMLARNPAPYATQRFGAATASREPVSPRQGLVLLLALVSGLVLGALLALVRGPVRQA